MPLVKTVTIKGNADFTKAKAELDDVAARARKLGEMDPTVTAKFDDGEALLKLKAFQLELKSLKQSGNDTGLQDLAGRLKAFGNESTSAKTKMAALRLESDALKGVLAGEGGNGGLVKAAEDTGSSFSALSGNAMPALIGAGALLSPVLLTLGFGLGGLGLAAAGAVGPIEKAAKASGGLQANLGKLTPEQRQVAESLLSLKIDYTAFQHALEPTVLKDFNAAIGAAQPILHGIEPVAKATGDALAQMLGSLGGEFGSREWQQFFAFMAREAGPDVHQLTTFLVQLTGTLPPLLETLQPVAVDLLKVANAAAYLAEHGAAAAQSITGIATSAAKAAPPSENLLQKFERWEYHLPIVGTISRNLMEQILGTGDASAKTAPKVDHLGALQAAAGVKTGEWAAAQRALNAALVKGLTPLQDYIGATLTQRNDLRHLNDALKTSGDRIGYNTQKQRDSFGAAQTYIQDLENTASKAIDAHKGIETQITSLERAIPRLEHVRGKTKDYRDELDKLRNMLRILRAEKAIGEVIHITGVGDWSLSGAPGHLLPHHRPTGHAAGYRVPGYGGGDRHLALLEGGETVVPKQLTPAVAPLMKAHGVPGFAAGGIMGGYHGNIPGLQSWTEGNRDATVAGITRDIGNAMAAQFKQMFAAPLGGHVGAGVAQWAGLVHQALAMEGLSQLLAGRVLYQMQTESGGNPNAINLTDSNAAAGDPSRGLMQTIGATFQTYHWPGTSWNIYDPLANIAAALNYADHRYGPSLMSGGMGIGSGHGYDSGGWLPTGLSLAFNGTGKPERVLGPGDGAVNVYLDVKVGHGTSPRQAAKELVSLINQGATAGIKIRKSAISVNG